MLLNSRRSIFFTSIILRELPTFSRDGKQRLSLSQLSFSLRSLSLSFRSPRVLFLHSSPFAATQIYKSRKKHYPLRVCPLTFKLTLQGLGQTATRSKFARDIRRALGVPRQAGKVKGLIHGVTASLDPSVDAGLDVNNLSSGRPTTKEKLRHLQHSLSSLLFFFKWGTSCSVVRKRYSVVGMVQWWRGLVGWDGLSINHTTRAPQPTRESTVAQRERSYDDKIRLVLRRKMVGWW